ncbi:uncharacterized protein LOC143030279 [Oratosquilla oratoria]|uniref:uncharacterized protein LOC143030279 n=1 Tax=Oratosquilla oratoria TaxID=337810 RepID=UPI003F7743E8
MANAPSTRQQPRTEQDGLASGDGRHRGDALVHVLSKSPKSSQSKPFNIPSSRARKSRRLGVGGRSCTGNPTGHREVYQDPSDDRERRALTTRPWLGWGVGVGVGGRRVLKMATSLSTLQEYHKEADILSSELNGLSDLDIFFPEDEDPIKAHRLVLSMSSPVLLDKLKGPLAADKELTLPEDLRKSFRKLLDHMYLNRMDMESVEEALEVYALAHKYRVGSAMEDCVQYIISNMKAEMIPVVLQTSVLHEDAALKKKCKEILDRDPDAVMLPETVSRLSKEGLRALLMDDTLVFSSEAVPFRGLIAWQVLALVATIPFPFALCAVFVLVVAHQARTLKCSQCFLFVAGEKTS